MTESLKRDLAAVIRAAASHIASLDKRSPPKTVEKPAQRPSNVPALSPQSYHAILNAHRVQLQLDHLFVVEDE